MNRSKKTILVTGSTGFFGRNLMQRLGKTEYRVHSLTSDLTKERDIMREVNEVRPDIVYHLGAYVNLTRDYSTSKTCIDVNIKGTAVLLEASSRIPIKRFIYTSTEEIYGDGKLPYVVGQALDPPSYYAMSKVAAENMSKIYAKTHGFPLYVFRVGTAYGAHMPMKRLIPQIIVKALQNEPILLNSGTKKRDYIYIEDVIDALVSAIDTKPSDTVTILNIGGGKNYSLHELVDTVLDITKSKSKVTYGAFADRVLEADEWLLDNQNAQYVLGWKPKTSMHKGLAKTIEHYRNMLKVKKI